MNPLVCSDGSESVNFLPFHDKLGDVRHWPRPFAFMVRVNVASLRKSYRRLLDHRRDAMLCYAVAIIVVLQPLCAPLPLQLCSFFLLAVACCLCCLSLPAGDTHTQHGHILFSLYFTLLAATWYIVQSEILRTDSLCASAAITDFLGTVQSDFTALTKNLASPILFSCIFLVCYYGCKLTIFITENKLFAFAFTSMLVIY